MEGFPYIFAYIYAYNPYSARDDFYLLKIKILLIDFHFCQISTAPLAGFPIALSVTNLFFEGKVSTFCIIAINVILSFFYPSSRSCHPICIVLLFGILHKWGKSTTNMNNDQQYPSDHPTLWIFRRGRVVELKLLAVFRSCKINE